MAAAADSAKAHMRLAIMGVSRQYAQRLVDASAPDNALKPARKALTEQRARRL
jgi:hypothetical protein